MPKGYIVANIAITDPQMWEAYRVAAASFVEERGGRYIIATESIEDREEPSSLHRLVVIEFPSLAEARALYDDPRYRSDILPYRLRAATSSVTFVEGCE